MKVINSVVLLSALLVGSLSVHADEPYPEGLPVPGQAQNESTPSHVESQDKMAAMHKMMSGMSADKSHAMMQACMTMMHKSDGERTPRSDS
jgi:hypothetical protein